MRGMNFIMSNNFNFDENMMNKIKNMVDNGNISEAMSQISPEMIQNFSKLMNQNNSNNLNNNNTSIQSNINNSNINDSHADEHKDQSNADFSNLNLNNLDMNTMMKITSALSQMNNKNDPRANLLYSLKPYLRDSKKNKLDQYAQLLNITKIADIMKNDKKENNSNA